LAEEIPKEVEEALSDDNEESGGKSKKTLFIIIGAVVILSGGLLFGAMSFFSSPELDGEKADLVVEEAVEDETEVEVKIDSFNCTNRSADEGSDIHVNFELWALVNRKLQLDFKADLKDVHKNRVKQSVEEIIRGAELHELDQGDKKDLKRKMKDRINKVMGRSYVAEILIVDYRTM
jgi:flagellar basal body-associated protein FliL